MRKKVPDNGCDVIAGEAGLVLVEVVLWDDNKRDLPYIR
jgi:hypothetical protein